MFPFLLHPLGKTRKQTYMKSWQVPFIGLTMKCGAVAKTNAFHRLTEAPGGRRVTVQMQVFAFYRVNSSNTAVLFANTKQKPKGRKQSYIPQESKPEYKCWHISFHLIKPASKIRQISKKLLTLIPHKRLSKLFNFLLLHDSCMECKPIKLKLLHSTGDPKVAFTLHWA